MKTSLELSPQPPSTVKSSPSRRKHTRASLASVDWHKVCRHESYSDADDELHARLEPPPLEAAACQSSAYGESMGIQSPGTYAGDSKDSQSASYGKGKELIHTRRADDGLQNRKVLKSAGYAGVRWDLQSSGYGDDRSSKTNFSANPRVDRSYILPQQPLWTFPGALKPAGKPHAAQLVAHAASEGSEPISPKVTCLGRVRIKETHSHDTEYTHFGCMRIKEKHGQDAQQAHTERQTFGNLLRHVADSKTQSADRNDKDGRHKGSNKRETAEKRSCFQRRKRREASEAETLKRFGPLKMEAETRRERAAMLARSLTSLLEDLRRLDMENSGYVPAVPPPNSLLLMRGFGILNKSPTTTPLDDGENAESSADGLPLHDLKTQKSTMKLTMRLENSNSKAAQKIFPLSELESNSLVQNASRFEMMMNKKQPAMGNCPPAQELELWQRRAITKLAAIDTKGLRMRMEIKQPSTN